MAKPRPRKERVFDQAKVETAARVIAEIRAAAVEELGASIKAAEDEIKRLFPDAVQRLRESAKTQNVNRELAQNVLQDPVSSVLGRIDNPPGGPREISRTERAAGELAGEARPRPRLAVTSPQTVARVVEAIVKRHPDIVAHWSKLGMTVEEGTWLIFRVLDYSKASAARKGSFERRVFGRGGILFEMLLPFQPDVVAKELEATAVNAADWIRSEPERFGRTAKDADALAQEVAGRIGAAAGNQPRYGRGLLQSADAPGLGEVDVLADNLRLVRLTDVRDEAGRLMSDHFRALLSIAPDGKSIDLVPVGVGESKFKSKRYEVIPQLLRNLERARESLRASNLPDLQNLEVRVRWGKSLVVIPQSEGALGARGSGSLQTAVREATGAKKMSVVTAQGATKEQAAASKDLIGKYMALADQANLGE